MVRNRRWLDRRLTRVISAHQAAIEPSTVPHHAENRSQAPVTFIFTTVTGKDMPAFDPAP